MKAHRLFRAGAALALLGAFASAQEQPDGFFAGLKLRGAFQAASREDHLMPVYLGFGVECGYQLGIGRLSAELGFTYKAGRQYLDDLTKMEVINNQLDIDGWAFDSRKNLVDGITMRLSYEKPFDKFAVRGGVQLGSLKFRQEYIGYLEAIDGDFCDTYNGVIDKGNLSVSPYIGVSFPFLTHHSVELNIVALNYKAINYVHVAGTVPGGWDLGQTTKDYVQESSRFIPHVELTFGFRF